MSKNPIHIYKYILMTRDGELMGMGRLSSPLQYASWDAAVEVIKKHNEGGKIEKLNVPCFVMMEREPYRFSRKSRVFECTAVVELVVDASLCELDEDGDDSPTFCDFIAATSRNKDDERNGDDH